MSTKGGEWAEAFLEMMAVERAAARNTLTAYGRDLRDADHRACVGAIGRRADAPRHIVGRRQLEMDSDGEIAR